MLRLLAASIFLLASTLAHGQSVESCDRNAMVGKNRSACGGYLSLTNVSAVQSSTQMLVCPTSPPPAGISACTAATWKLRSSLLPTDMVSYCAKTPNPGWGSCGGSESWKAVSAVFGGTTPPPSPPPGPVLVGESTIAWTSPTNCAVVAPFSECTPTGYRLEYGQNNLFSNSVVVAPTVFSYTLTGLAAGTWQARLVTLSGNEFSMPSSVVVVIIAATPPPATSWVVAPNTGNARPVYEAVLNASSSALVRGNTEGTIPVATPCGNEVYKVSTDSYRDVPETAIALTSPTYSGRRHTAVCVLQ